MAENDSGEQQQKPRKYENDTNETIPNEKMEVARNQQVDSPRKKFDFLVFSWALTIIKFPWNVLLRVLRWSAFAIQWSIWGYAAALKGTNGNKKSGSQYSSEHELQTVPVHSKLAHREESKEYTKRPTVAETLKATAPCFYPQEKATTPSFYGQQKNFKRDFHHSDQRVSKSQKAEKEKKRFLSMSIDEKRKVYKCGPNFTTLDDIPTLLQQDCRDALQVNSGVNAEIASKVSVWQGDITTLEIDAVVNAANSSLLGGGGVDGAIHRAAGSGLVDESSLLGGCKTGEAKITGGYRLPSKYVIHTVGPTDGDGRKLQSCYQKSLNLLLENNLRSVAFPCIATGIYGFPNDEAAKIAISTVRSFLEEHSNAVDRIIFCLFLEMDINCYNHFIPIFFPLTECSSDD